MKLNICVPTKNVYPRLPVRETEELSRENFQETGENLKLVANDAMKDFDLPNMCYLL